MAEKYVSIRVILDKIMRHPLMTDISFEAVVDYTVDFFQIVGVPRMFIQKPGFIDILSYRGKIPCDWVQTI